MYAMGCLQFGLNRLRLRMGFLWIVAYKNVTGIIDKRYLHLINLVGEIGKSF